MGTTSSQRDRRGLIAAAVTALLLIAGLAAIARGVAGGAGAAPPQPAAPASAAPSPPARPTGPTPTPAGGAASATSRAPAEPPTTDFGPLMGPSKPVGLRIPAIGLATTGVVDLGLDATGKLEAPKDFDRTGWYAAGPTPGEFGPFVIGGHVDSKSGPAVFYRLGALVKGDKVMVTREDGSVATFVIDKVDRYAKAEFPTALVYGNTTNRAEIRLITCGGAFDRATGHYVDNIVAFGHLVAT